MKNFGIERKELALRMGYTNIGKGCRRIDELCSGDLQLARNLRLALAQGLGVDVKIIEESIRFTHEQNLAKKEADYRKNFKPHAVILTEKQRPSSITMYALTGGSNRLLIPFPENSEPKTYAVAARDNLPETVPYMGRTTGYVINYTPDFALRFDSRGKLLEEFDRAFLPGQASVSVGDKRVNEKTWSKLLPVGVNNNE